MQISVAVTYKEKGDDIACADLYPKFLANCTRFGNGYQGEGLGACVEDSVNDCPQERSPPLTWT